MKGEDNVKMTKMKEIAIYARVSKALDQNPENQLIALRDYAIRNNDKLQVIGEFVDEISSRDTRPKKEEVLKLLKLGQLDGVLVWSLDRWGRSMGELVLDLEWFSQNNKAFISLKEGIDLSTSAGRLMANILSAMANFERDRISERTKLGLTRAKAHGKIKPRGKDKNPRKKSGYWLRWAGKKRVSENKTIISDVKSHE